MATNPNALFNPDDPLALRARAPGLMLAGGTATVSAPPPVSGLSTVSERPATTAQGQPAAAPSSPARQSANEQQPLPIARSGANPSPVALQTPNQKDLARLEASKPGYAQVKNPFLRGLATAGNIASGFFPRIAPLIPGTEAHHGLELARAANAVKREQTGNTAEAEDELRRAQAGEAEARTQQIENPAAKQEEAGKTVTTDQGIMQWNPATQRYDIKAGNAPEKQGKETGTVHQLDDGTLIMAHPDGTATPVTIDGKPVKGPAKEQPKGSPEQQFIDEYRQKNPNASIADAEKAFKQLTPKEPVDRGVTMVDPTTHKLIRVEPGQTLPTGATTPQQAGSAVTPTAQTRTMAETAPKVLDLAGRVGQLVDRQTKTLGPAASRWAEFMAGRVGAPNPEFTKLRTDVGLLQTALMRMHVGARGGEQMMEHFRDLIDVAKQSPENLKAALEEITAYARSVAEEGKIGGPAPETGTQTFQDGGKTYSIPAAQVADFKRDHPNAR